MSHTKVPYVPSTGWDILKLDPQKVVGLRFDHETQITGDAFHGLTLEQAKQLISDLQMHVDYLSKLS